MKLVDHAIECVKLGYSVIPCRAGTKAPDKTNWTAADLEEVGSIRSQFNANPSAYGMVVPRGVIVLDFDAGADGHGLDPHTGLLEILDRAESPVSATGSGGRHYFFWCPDDLAHIGSCQWQPNLDLKANQRGFIVLPPSEHPDTFLTYEWIRPLVAAADLPVLPEEIAREILVDFPVKVSSGRVLDSVAPDETRIRAALRTAVETIEAAPNGDRNNTLNRAAYTFAGVCAAEGVDPEMYRPEIEAAAGAIGLDASEIAATLRSGISRGESEPLEDSIRLGAVELLEDDPLGELPGASFADGAGVGAHAAAFTALAKQATRENTARRYDCTDIGNADRYYYINRDRARYNTALGWYAWDGRRWARDEGECLIMQFARDVRRAIHREAELAYNADDEDTGKALFKHATKTGGSQGLKSMLGLAARDLELWRSADNFDIDPYLLNVANGTIDLRTGELKPHSRGDYLTRLAPVLFDPKATIKGTRWERFLEEIMPDPELRRFLQVAMGYSATGLTSERGFFVCYGETGSNGKSVFMETIGRVLGVDYFRKAPQGTFIKSHNKSPANIAANIFGSRIIYDSELNEADRLDESTLKSLTGDSSVSACLKYKEPFEYQPTYALWLSTNHRPRIRGTDHAIWSRVNLIPFDVQIPEERQDRLLGLKLARESSAILGWIVEGARTWCESGLHRPEAVRAAVDEYRNDSDTVKQWFADCAVYDPQSEVDTKTLYNSFKSWAGENSEKSLGARWFGRRLKTIDRVRNREANGQRLWRGIRLIDGPVTNF